MSMTTDPRYLAHFTDPIYADNGSDAAPFGSDQGADMLHDYEVAGHDIPVGASIATLMPWDTIEGAFAAAENGDADGLLVIYAAGFLLLRYTGQITQDDYQVLRSALVKIADDLEQHAEGDCCTDR